MLHKVGYQPSNFHDDTQTVLVHNSTETVSSSILLYVNLNSRHFRDNKSIIARLEISSNLNQPAEVFFTQPDGTLIQFPHCCDSSQLVSYSHQHTIRLTYPSSDNDFMIHSLLWLEFGTPDSLNLFVNKTGIYAWIV